MASYRDLNDPDVNDFLDRVSNGTAGVDPQANAMARTTGNPQAQAEGNMILARQAAERDAQQQQQAAQIQQDAIKAQKDQAKAQEEQQKATVRAAAAAGMQTGIGIASGKQEVKTDDTGKPLWKVGAVAPPRQVPAVNDAMTTVPGLGDIYQHGHMGMPVGYEPANGQAAVQTWRDEHNNQVTRPVPTKTDMDTGNVTTTGKDQFGAPTTVNAGTDFANQAQAQAKADLDQRHATIQAREAQIQMRRLQFDPAFKAVDDAATDAGRELAAFYKSPKFIRTDDGKWAKRDADTDLPKKVTTVKVIGGKVYQPGEVEPTDPEELTKWQRQKDYLESVNAQAQAARNKLQPAADQLKVAEQKVKQDRYQHSLDLIRHLHPGIDDGSADLLAATQTGQPSQTAQAFDAITGLPAAAPPFNGPPAPQDSAQPGIASGANPQQPQPAATGKQLPTTGQNPQFDAWKAQYAPNDTGKDYDLMGAFSAGIKPDGDRGHFPDTFKLPNHPTFSDQSQYSTKDAPGGKWGTDADGKDTFTPSPWMAKDPARMAYLKDYMAKAEPNAKLILPEAKTAPSAAAQPLIPLDQMDDPSKLTAASKLVGGLKDPASVKVETLPAGVTALTRNGDNIGFMSRDSQGNPMFELSSSVEGSDLRHHVDFSATTGIPIYLQRAPGTEPHDPVKGAQYVASVMAAVKNVTDNPGSYANPQAANDAVKTSLQALQATPDQISAKVRTGQLAVQQGQATMKNVWGMSLQPDDPSDLKLFHEWFIKQPADVQKAWKNSTTPEESNPIKAEYLKDWIQNNAWKPGMDQAFVDKTWKQQLPGRAPEGQLETIGRNLVMDTVPAIGTAVGAAIGGLLGIESGPGAVATATAGGMAGAAIATKAQKAIFHAVFGDNAMKEMEYQQAANRAAHPGADQIGAMAPLLISCIGNPVGGAVKVEGKLLGRALTASGKAAIAANEAAPWAERVAQNWATGMRVGGGDKLRDWVNDKTNPDGSPITPLSVLNSMAREGVTFGSLGFAPEAIAALPIMKNIFVKAGYKGVADSTLMATSGVLYDALTTGKAPDWSRAAAESKSGITPFFLQNLVMGALHRSLTGRKTDARPQPGDEAPPADSAPPVPHDPVAIAAMGDQEYGDWINKNTPVDASSVSSPDHLKAVEAGITAARARGDNHTADILTAQLHNSEQPTNHQPGGENDLSPESAQLFNRNARNFNQALAATKERLGIESAPPAATGDQNAPAGTPGAGQGTQAEPTPVTMHPWASQEPAIYAGSEEANKPSVRDAVSEAYTNGQAVHAGMAKIAEKAGVPIPSHYEKQGNLLVPNRESRTPAPAAHTPAIQLPPMELKGGNKPATPAATAAQPHPESRVGDHPVAVANRIKDRVEAEMPKTKGRIDIRHEEGPSPTGGAEVGSDGRMTLRLPDIAAHLNRFDPKAVEDSVVRIAVAHEAVHMVQVEAVKSLWETAKKSGSKQDYPEFFHELYGKLHGELAPEAINAAREIYGADAWDALPDDSTRAAELARMLVEAKLNPDPAKADQFSELYRALKLKQSPTLIATIRQAVETMIRMIKSGELPESWKEHIGKLEELYRDMAGEEAEPKDEPKQEPPKPDTKPAATDDEYTAVPNPDGKTATIHENGKPIGNVPADKAEGFLTDLRNAKTAPIPVTRRAITAAKDTLRERLTAQQDDDLTNAMEPLAELMEKMPPDERQPWVEQQIEDWLAPIRAEQEAKAQRSAIQREFRDRQKRRRVERAKAITNESGSIFAKMAEHGKLEPPPNLIGMLARKRAGKPLTEADIKAKRDSQTWDDVPGKSSFRGGKNSTLMGDVIDQYTAAAPGEGLAPDEMASELGMDLKEFTEQLQKELRQVANGKPDGALSDEQIGEMSDAQIAKYMADHPSEFADNAPRVTPEQQAAQDAAHEAEIEAQARKAEEDASNTLHWQDFAGPDAKVGTKTAARAQEIFTGKWKDAEERENDPFYEPQPDEQKQWMADALKQAQEEDAAKSRPIAEGHDLLGNPAAYREETPEAPIGSPVTTQKIKAQAPYLMSGNKGDIVGRHGKLFQTLAKGASKVIDAFGGAGIYTHFLAKAGLMPKGSTFNEWTHTRTITNSQLRDRAHDVTQAVASLNAEYLRAFPRETLPKSRDEMLKTREKILDWATQKVRDLVGDNPKNDDQERLVLPENPKTAALYLFLQNHAKENRVIDFSLVDGKVEITNSTKVLGKDDFDFVSHDEDTNVVKWNPSGKVTQPIHKLGQFLKNAGEDFKGMDITRGDGWEAAANAPDDALAFVDTSYFPSDEDAAKGHKVMNYGGKTEADGDWRTNLAKIRKYLLPNANRVRYVLTNNFNSNVVEALEKDGWTVLHTIRNPKKPQHEFIALSPAAARAAGIEASGPRRYAPGGFERTDMGSAESQGLPETGQRPGDGRDVRDVPGIGVQPQQPAGGRNTGGKPPGELAGDGQRVLQPEPGTGREVGADREAVEHTDPSEWPLFSSPVPEEKPKQSLAEFKEQRKASAREMMAAREASESTINPRDRNQSPGRDYPVPPNSIAIQPRGLDTIPLSDKVYTYPYDGTAADAAKVGAKAFKELNAKFPEMSQRESVFIGSNDDGMARHRMEMDFVHDRVKVTTMGKEQGKITDLTTAATAPDATTKLGDVKVGTMSALGAYRTLTAKLERTGGLTDAEQGKLDAASKALEQRLAAPTGESIPTTGKPYDFHSVRNTEKSPNAGSRFGQDVEPAGKYMVESSPESAKGLDPKFEHGPARLESPLVLPFGGGYGEESNWKNVLSKQFDGKKGKELSQAVRDAGYDGIITTEPSTGPNRPAHTSEIVDLRSITPTDPNGQMRLLSSPVSKDYDARYLELAKDPEKNRDELQRMVDERAKTAGGKQVESDTLLDPEKIEPVNEIDKPKQVTTQAKIMRKEGWIGRPLLVADEGDRIQAFTGSHRLAAAVEAGLDEIPVVHIPVEELARWIEEGGDEYDSLFVDYQGFSNGRESDKLDDLKRARMDGIEGLDDAIDLLEIEDESNFLDTKERGPLHRNPWIVDGRVKSADPITRDSAGNVIPLSQRFNPESDSILRSSPAPDDTTSQQAVRAVLDRMGKRERDIYNDTNAGMPLAEVMKKHGVSAKGVGNLLDQVRARMQTVISAASPDGLKPVMRGDKIVGGRPDLAGSTVPEIAAIHQIRNENGLPDRVNLAEIHARARQTVDSDFNGTINNLLDKQSRREPYTLDDAAQAQYISRKMVLAGEDNTTENRVKIGQLTTGYIDIGTDLARSMRIRVDDAATPAERHAQYIAGALYTPDDVIRKQMRNAKPEVARQIMEKWVTTKTDRIKAEMLSQGIDIDASLKQYREAEEERQQAAEESPRTQKAIDETFAKLNTADKVAIKAINTGASVEMAAMISGISVFDLEQSYRRYTDSILKAMKETAKRHVDNAALASSPAHDALWDILGELGVKKWEDIPKTEVDRERMMVEKQQAKRKQSSKPKAPKAPGAATPEATDANQQNIPLEGSAKDADPDHQGLFIPEGPKQGQQDIDLHGTAADPGDHEGLFIGDTVDKKTVMSDKKANWKSKFTTLEDGTMLERRVDKKGKVTWKVTSGTFDLNDPIAVKHVLDAFGVARGGWGDKMMDYWRMSVLTGPQTMIVNASSHAAHALWNAVPRRLLEATVNNTLGLVGQSSPDAATFGEFKPMAKALGAAFHTAARMALTSWKLGGLRTFQAYAEGKALDLQSLGVGGEYLPPAISGKFGDLMRSISYKPMAAADEFIKSIYGTLQTAAIAHRMAAVAEGLKGDAYEARLNELMQPGSEAAIRAMDNTQRTAFQEKLDGKNPQAIYRLDQASQWLKKMRREPYIGKPLSFIIPFVDTPTNLAKLGMEMTPLNGFLIAADMARSLKRRMFNGDIPKEEAIRQANEIYDRMRLVKDITNQTMAWAAFLAIRNLISSDNEDGLPWITGTTSYTATKRGERDNANAVMPPMSIRLGKWQFRYNRMEPFAIALATAADLAHSNEQQGGFGMASASETAAKFKDQMKEKTFLYGITNLITAFEQPERFTQREIGGILTGFVPNLIRQTIRESDTQGRNTYANTKLGWWNSLAKTVGYQVVPQFAPQKIDVWGRPVMTNRGDLIGGTRPTDLAMHIFDPSNLTINPHILPIDRWIFRYNHQVAEDSSAIGIQPIKDTIEVTDPVTKKRTQVPLSEQEHEQANIAAGQMALKALGDGWEDRPLTDDNAKLITKVVGQCQEAQRKILHANKLVEMLGKK